MRNSQRKPDDKAPERPTEEEIRILHEMKTWVRRSSQWDKTRKTRGDGGR